MPCFHPGVKKVGRHLPLGPSEKAVLVGHPFFTGGMETGPVSKPLYLFLCFSATVRRKPLRSKHIMQLLELYKGEF